MKQVLDVISLGEPQMVYDTLEEEKKKIKDSNLQQFLNQVVLVTKKNCVVQMANIFCLHLAATYSKDNVNDIRRLVLDSLYQLEIGQEDSLQHIEYMTGWIADIFRKILKGVTNPAMRVKLIPLLLLYIKRCRISNVGITQLHTLLLEECIKLKLFHIAERFLDENIEAVVVRKQRHHKMPLEQVQQYFFNAGIVYLNQQRYEDGLEQLRYMQQIKVPFYQEYNMVCCKFQLLVGLLLGKKPYTRKFYNDAVEFRDQLKVYYDLINFKSAEEYQILYLASEQTIVSQDDHFELVKSIFPQIMHGQYLSILKKQRKVYSQLTFSKIGQLFEKNLTGGELIDILLSINQNLGILRIDSRNQLVKFKYVGDNIQGFVDRNIALAIRLQELVNRQF